MTGSALAGTKIAAVDRKIADYLGEAFALNQDVIAQPLSGMFGERLAKPIARPQLNVTIGAEPLANTNLNSNLVLI